MGICYLFIAIDQTGLEEDETDGGEQASDVQFMTTEQIYYYQKFHSTFCPFLICV